ncbi:MULTISPECIES: YegP family protein [unclassified Solwaraspora]|uniref:YegP family protein n=1 Tax=unclassified Solwaraspora TaxID=2627926 RepID=UPI00259B0090|nr:YegP family protein [Solwaraspora sp. WMMA2056]WJK42015.1 YegP family protein [Solwaraspora sp. WMMA2056]
MEIQIHYSSNPTQQYYWQIVASNGRILATSETYYNKSDAMSAARSVKYQAGSAPIVDHTVGSSSYGRW